MSAAYHSGLGQATGVGELVPFIAPDYALPDISDAGNRVFGRTMQTLEQLPIVRHAQSTAGLVLTTTPQQVPSLETTVTVPAGAVIVIDVVLDIHSSGTCIGILENMPPGNGTTFSVDLTSAQVLNLGNPLRGTFGQIYTITNPPRGPWAFRVMGEHSSGASGSIQGAHSNMRVTVL